MNGQWRGRFAKTIFVMQACPRRDQWGIRCPDDAAICEMALGGRYVPAAGIPPRQSAILTKLITVAIIGCSGWATPNNERID
jgi:hypothetical protein